VFDPLNTNNPALLFNTDPPPLITPLKLPSPTLNAVPFKLNAPSPPNVATVCAPLQKLALPPTVNTVLLDSNPLAPTFNTPTAPTTMLPLLSVPFNANTPAFTLVCPL
jgi:hypothetical protein